MFIPCWHCTATALVAFLRLFSRLHWGCMMRFLPVHCHGCVRWEGCEESAAGHVERQKENTRLFSQSNMSSWSQYCGSCSR
ncbi:hypothetical protein CC86DRAFT_107224 [Ophiobolus disseminans]|uniref:Secreted protein n=1 Tax=Ophiobolus disseminans TaxID=1469910 RepID=A0A6A6ZIS1_9PLEO|nr:hypothetical protein CC86DRAFT_107224 [Ophiobolus disseminans]